MSENKFGPKLGRTPFGIWMEPFSGNTKPNLELKIVLRMEIL
jgi:hypothetical protein